VLVAAQITDQERVRTPIGTGTTLHACLLEGMRGIGIERNSGYTKLCKIRLLAAEPPGRWPQEPA